MDESRCFFKSLPTKGLALKGKKIKGGESLSRGSQLHFSPLQMEKELVNQLLFGGVKHQGFFDQLVRPISLVKSLKILDASRNYKKSPANSELSNGEGGKKYHFVFG